MWWQILIGVTAGVAVLYAVLVALLWHAARRTGNGAQPRDALRLLPDLVRLLRRLAADPTLPHGVRLRLLLLIGYLALPIDLIPDFIPVLGYADDAIVVALALRSVARAAGPEALTRHWPGTATGLEIVQRLAGLQATRPSL
jgi:uncharacterized membrane protein YkvA (DUF1232 family)